MSKLVTPYDSPESKKKQVTDMFDNIAPKYDLLNRMLSLGIDVQWRKKLVRAVAEAQPQTVLDVATGTGDVALMLARSRAAPQVTGLDISANMLQLAKQKSIKAQLSDNTHFMQGDSEALPFENDRYDAVTVAFGVRNFENTITGLTECFRVLRPGGTLFVLEFSHPSSFPIKQIYNLYFKYVLPMIGRLTSKDPKAYTYLFESVEAFPQREGFVAMLKEAGFASGTFRSLTLGICTLYTSQK